MAVKHTFWFAAKLCFSIMASLWIREIKRWGKAGRETCQPTFVFPRILRSSSCVPVVCPYERVTSNWQGTRWCVLLLFFSVRVGRREHRKQKCRGRAPGIHLAGLFTRWDDFDQCPLVWWSGTFRAVEANKNLLALGILPPELGHVANKSVLNGSLC